ncbi:MAG TPA: hypothetical protein EYO59_07465 [Chromatiaceae bacterium]|nr:hypothetical protein [Chromatiaceae bacterium]
MMRLCENINRKITNPDRPLLDLQDQKDRDGSPELQIYPNHHHCESKSQEPYNPPNSLQLTTSSSCNHTKDTDPAPPSFPWQSSNEKREDSTKLTVKLAAFIRNTKLTGSELTINLVLEFLGKEFYKHQIHPSVLSPDMYPMKRRLLMDCRLDPKMQLNLGFNLEWHATRLLRYLHISLKDKDPPNPHAKGHWLHKVLKKQKKKNPTPTKNLEIITLALKQQQPLLKHKITTYLLGCLVFAVICIVCVAICFTLYKDTQQAFFLISGTVTIILPILACFFVMTCRREHLAFKKFEPNNQVRRETEQLISQYPHCACPEQLPV